MTNINVRDFIINNYTPYYGGEEFLVGPTSKTEKLWHHCQRLLAHEVDVEVLDIDLDNISGIDSFMPGYIDKENEVILGLQSDAPLKRIMNPYGGIRMVLSSLRQYNYDVPQVLTPFVEGTIKTHNQGVFDVYNDQIKKARKCGLLTGLPDAYGRGRIIGDYRRIPLYGIDFLIEQRLRVKQEMDHVGYQKIVDRLEKLNDEINALKAMKSMAMKYGYDISKPAKNSKEAVQFLYFGYLAAVKENNGAAMSLGRVSTFLDIYFEKDLSLGLVTEENLQELIDQFVIKLRLVRHLRTKEYNELFAGDPTWITESLGGQSSDGRTLVTKTTYRFLNTLRNLGAAPEPNMTVLWHQSMPKSFKKFCTKLSIETGAIQYENDDLMRKDYGDDYGIACCVSPMEIGKSMQYFGARCNLAKALLYSLNAGVDELLEIKVFEGIENLSNKEVLDYKEVMKNYKLTLSKVAKLYVETMNIIHQQHDKYAYEAGQMALHDVEVKRTMAFGVAGLSVVADALSAIKYGHVKGLLEDDLMKDFEITGDFPKYGNNNPKVDKIANEILSYFIGELRRYETYQNAKHTLSVLTITSNVVYGKKTGSTPDGRKIGEPFAPGANPMHGRDQSGALASLKSVSQLPFYGVCEDGISNTFTITPKTLGKSDEIQTNNLTSILDGYFLDGGHHLNVNVFNRETLIDAKDNPHLYPNLTIRVSGYAVKFIKLSDEQQQDVINRTFHEAV